MKFIQFALFLFCLSIANLSFAQDWERTFNHISGYAKGFDVIQTADGGYVMVGEVDLPTGAIRHYIYLVKVDNSGNEIWSKVYNEADVVDQNGKAVVESTNGDLFVAGSRNGKASVLKTNLNGDVLWIKDYGGQGYNFFEDIALDDNGNLILVGNYEEQAGSGQHEIWAMSMNTEGDSLWSQRYFEPSLFGSAAMDISSFHTGKFLVTGHTDGKGFVTEINAIDGTQNWANFYQLVNIDQLFSTAAFSGGSRLLVGGSGLGFVGFNPVLFETDSVGTLIDYVEFNSVPIGKITSIEATSDAGFILTGSSHDLWIQDPNSTGFITKLDDNFEVEWELTFEDSLDQQGATIRQFSDGSYVLAGSRTNGMWLKKIAGPTTAATDLTEQSFDVKVYPNPARQTINIELPESINAYGLSIRIYDSLGRIVEERDLKEIVNLIEVGKLARGVYHYTIQNNKKQLTSGEIILQ